jgi:hypothetical protein
MQNGQKHFSGHLTGQRNRTNDAPAIDAFSSADHQAMDTIVEAHSFLVKRAFFRWRTTLHAPPHSPA